MDVSQLEPADRDPKKLWATALVVVLIMVISGVVVTFAYDKFNDRTVDNTRPALLTKITEPEVELLTADGKQRNLQDLKGEVTLAITLPIHPQPESQPSLDALKVVMESFKDAPKKPRILIFVLDGSNADPGKMSGVLSEYGAEPEVLRVVTNDDGKSSLRSFLKAKLRFNVTPTEKDGKFDYDTRLVLLDQHLHVRGWPGASRGWDFEKVTRHEKAYAAALEVKPKDEVPPPPMTTPRLREMLIDSINYLYEHPDEKGQK